MATYKTITFNSTNELRDAINNDLSQLAYPFEVKHRLNGIGRLVYAKAPLTGDSLYVTIDFDSIGTKMFAIKSLFENRLLEMSEVEKTVLMLAQTAFETDYKEVERAKREANRLAYEQKKQAEEEQKLEAKYQASKTKTIKEFEDLTKRDKTMSTVNEFY